MRKAVLRFSWVAGLAFALSAPVSAQSVNLDSSLTAWCQDQSCSVLKFLLELNGTSTVDYLELQSHTPTWEFGKLVAVIDERDAPIAVDWITGSHPNQFTLYFMANASPEPITLIVNMLASGTQDDLYPGALTYFGAGIDSGGHYGDFRGTVVPEPATLAMLLPGVFGVGLLSRRRRRNPVA